MNTSMLNKLTYVFQDYLLKKRTSFKNFRFIVCKYFFVPVHQLERIYAFIDTVKQQPKIILLAQPLRYVFELLLAVINTDSEKHLMEYIDESNKRPCLDLLSESYPFEMPEFYILSGRKLNLNFPLQSITKKITWNIWCYFLHNKIFVLDDTYKNVAYFGKMKTPVYIFPKNGYWGFMKRLPHPKKNGIYFNVLVCCNI